MLAGAVNACSSSPEVRSVVRGGVGVHVVAVTVGGLGHKGVGLGGVHLVRVVREAAGGIGDDVGHGQRVRGRVGGLVVVPACGIRGYARNSQKERAEKKKG